MNENINTIPDIKISVKQTFGIDSNLEVDAFSKKNEYVPDNIASVVSLSNL